MAKIDRLKSFRKELEAINKELNKLGTGQAPQLQIKTSPDLEAKLKGIHIAAFRTLDDLHLGKSIGQDAADIIGATKVKVDSSVHLQAIQAENNRLVQELSKVAFPKVELEPGNFVERFSDSFKDLSKNIGESVSESVGKVRLKSQGQGILGTIRTGLFERVGQRITDDIDKTLGDTFNVNFSDITAAKKIIESIKSPLEAIKDSNALNDFINNVARAITNPIDKAIVRSGDIFVKTINDRKTPIKTLINEIREGLTLENVVSEASNLVSNLKLATQEAVSFNSVFELTNRSFEDARQLVSKRSKEKLETVGVQRLESRVEELRSTKDKTAKKAVLKEGKEQLVFVMGGIGGFGGTSAANIQREIGRVVDKKTQVVSIRNKSLDPSELTPEEKAGLGSSREQALRGVRQYSGAIQGIAQGFNNDSIELAAQVITAIESNPESEVKIKIVTESGSGIAASEATELLNLLGYGDKFETLALGITGRKDTSKIDNFSNVLSPEDETLGAPLALNDITGIRQMIVKLLLGDIKSDAPIGVQTHLVKEEGYLQLAEFRKLMGDSLGDIDENLISEFENRAQVLESLTRHPEKLESQEQLSNTEEIFKLLQDVRLGIMESEGEIKERLLAVSKSLEKSFSIKKFDKGGGFKELLGAVNTKFEKIKQDISSQGDDVKDFSELETFSRNVDGVKQEIAESMGKFNSGVGFVAINSYLEIIEDIEKQANKILGVGNDLKSKITEPTTITKLQKEPPTFDSTQSQILPSETKQFSQEIQILTAQLRNVREQNISTMAFEVVNSLKNLNAQIFKTEQRLVDFQAPQFDFDPPQLPEFNVSVLSAVELSDKIGMEMRQLLSGVTELNQEIRNQRLPDLLGSDSGGIDPNQVRTGLDAVVGSLIQFGQGVVNVDAGLSNDFVSLRQTFFDLAQNIRSSDFVDQVKAASLALFNFSKSADIQDPQLLDQFSQVGRRLQVFQKQLQDVRPEQAENAVKSSLGESLRMLGESGLKATAAFEKATERLNSTQPPDFQDLLNSPLDVVRQELSRTAQVTGLANVELGGFGSTLTRVKEGLGNFLNGLKPEKLDLGLDSISEESQEMVKAFKKARMEAFDLSNSLSRLRFRDNLGDVTAFTQRISNSLQDVDQALEKAAGNLIALENLESQLTDVTFSILNSAKVNAAILDRVSPSLVAVGEQIVSFDQNVGRNLAGLGDELPKVLGGFEGFTELAVILARAVEQLTDKVEQFEVDPEQFEAKLEALISKVVNTLESKISQIQIPDAQAVAAGNRATELEAVAAGDRTPEAPPTPRSTGDPQVPPSDAATVPTSKPSTGNKKLDKIEASLNEFRDDLARKKAQEIEARKRQMLSAEDEEALNRKLEELRRAGAKAALEALSPGVLRRALLGNFPGDPGEALREEVEKQNPKFLESIEKNAAKIKNESLRKRERDKAANEANKDALRIFDELFNKGTEGEKQLVVDTINNILKQQQKELQSVLAGQNEYFKDLEAFLKNQFSRGVTEGLEKVAKGEGFEVDAFISKENFNPLIEEYKQAAKVIREMSEELVRSEELHNSNSSAIQDQIFRIQELAKIVDQQIGPVLSRAAENPLIQGKNRQSISGSLSSIQANRERAELTLPALQISQGQLPDTDVLSKLLERVKGQEFKEGLELGTETYRGIVEGIKAGLPLVEGAGDELALELLESIARELEIKSPSQAIKRLMKFVVDGVVVGLAGGKKAVQGALEDILSLEELKSEVRKASNVIESELQKALDLGDLPEDKFDRITKKISSIQAELSNPNLGGEGIHRLSKDLKELADETEKSFEGVPTAVADNIQAAKQKLTSFVLSGTGIISLVPDDPELLGNKATPLGEKLGFASAQAANFVQQNELITKTVGLSAKAVEAVTTKVKNLQREFSKGFRENEGAKAFQELRQEVGKLGAEIKERFPVFSKFGGFFRNAFFAGLAVFGINQISDAVVDLGRNVTQTFIEVQRNLTALRNASGGERSGEFLKAFSKERALDIKAVASSLSQLSIATKGTVLEGARTRNIFESLTLAAQQNALTPEQQQSIITQISQSINKGRVLREELSVLAENGINLQKVLEESLGMSGAEVSKFIESGKVGVKELADAIELLGNKSKEGADDFLGSIAGSAAKARALWQELVLELGEQFKPFIAETLTNSINMFQTLIAITRELGPGLMAALDALSLPVRIYLEVVKFTLKVASMIPLVKPVFDAIVQFLDAAFIKTGLLRGAVTGLTIFLAGSLMLTLKSLAAVALPLLAKAMAAVIASMTTMATHPVGLSLAALGVVVATLSRDFSELDRIGKTVVTMLGAVAAAAAAAITIWLISIGKIAAVVTIMGKMITLSNPFIIALAAVGAVAFAVKVHFDDLAAAFAGVNAEMVKFNQADKIAARLQITNEASKKLAKGVSLTKDELAELIKTLDDEVQQGGLNAAVAEKLKNNYQKLQVEAIQLEESYNALTDSLIDSTEAFDKNSEAIELNNAKMKTAIAEELAKGLITTEEAQSRREALEAEHTEALNEQAVEQLANLESNLAEMERLRAQNPSFDLDESRKEAFEKLEKDVVEARLNVQQTSLAKFDKIRSEIDRKEKERIDKITDIEEDRTQAQALEIAERERAIQEGLTHQILSEEHAALKSAQIAQDKASAELSIEREKLAKLQSLPATQDKQIQEERVKLVEESQLKIVQLEKDSIKSISDLRKAADDIRKAEADALVELSEKVQFELKQEELKGEIERRRLVQMGVLDKKDAELQKLDDQANAAQKSIELERDRLQKLQALEMPVGEDARKQREKDIRDAITKTKEATLSALEAEESRQVAVKDRVIEKLQQQRQLQSSINELTFAGVNAQKEALSIGENLLSQIQRLNQAKADFKSSEIELSKVVLEADQARYEAAQEEDAARTQRHQEQWDFQKQFKEATREERRELRRQEGERLRQIREEANAEQEQMRFKKRGLELEREQLLLNQQAQLESKAIEMEIQELKREGLLIEKQLAILQQQEALLDNQIALAEAIKNGDESEILAAQTKVSLAQQQLDLREKLLGLELKGVGLEGKASRKDLETTLNQFKAERKRFSLQSSQELGTRPTDEDFGKLKQLTASNLSSLLPKGAQSALNQISLDSLKMPDFGPQIEKMTNQISQLKTQNAELTDKLIGSAKEETKKVVRAIQSKIQPAPPNLRNNRIQNAAL